MITSPAWLTRFLAILLVAVVALPALGADPAPARCPSGVDWTDEVVAKAVGLSESRLEVLKKTRVLSNAEVCTMPKARLDRAIWRSENPKPDSPGEWAKFRAQQQMDETGTVKPDGLIRAIEQRAAIIQRAALAGTSARPIAGIGPNQWTELGPGNIGGRVRGLAIHPTVAGTMWAGSVAGGIWKTVNDGASWAPVNDFAGNLSISSIVISHANPSVMYASTGEGFFNADAVRGAGIFRSTDGGVTWTQLPSTNPTLGTQWYYVNRLVMHPSNANILLAATNEGLYRTTDAGATWTLTTSSFLRVPDVRFNPLDGSKVVMGSSSFVNSSLMYSTDAGATWLASNLFVSGRAEIGYSRQSGVVYASVDVSSGRIYRSADNGATWTLQAILGHLSQQGWYDNAIWVDPVDSDHLIVGGIDLFRSTNGGVSWTKISQWFNVDFGSVHADHHVIVNAPGYNGTSNRTVYFGNDGGVYKAQDITAVTSPVTGWTKLNNGLGITQFYSGAGHNGLNGRIIGGTQDNGSLRNAPAGTNWSAFFGGDGGASAIDPTDGNYIYGEYVFLQIHRSTNGGATQSSYIWPGIGDANNSSRSNFISPFVLDPSNPNTMIAGGQSVWRSTNVKAPIVNWTSIMGVTGGGGYSSLTSAIAVAPQDSNIIWIGKNGGALYKSTNGTIAIPTWSQIGAATLPAGRQLLSIHVDPTNANVVYVGFGGYSQANLWKTTDGGTTWTSIGGALPESPIRSVTTNPLNASHVYAATEVGVFASENGGATWGTTNDGPANVSVDQLFWLDSSTLVAATHGRGMFKTTVTGGSQFRFLAAAYTVSEAAGSVTIPVVRSLTTGTASVRYATANGTAAAGADYTATSGVLNFAAGVGTQNIVIPILNDIAGERSETFTVALSNPVNGALGTPVSATVTISDNDVPRIRLGAAVYSVAETGPSVTIPVTRSITTGPASVQYATANGTATAGADYTATSGTLNFAAGVGTQNIVVPIINDTLQEPDETFTVTISAPAGGALTAPTTATVTILANDGATVRLGAAAYSVAETGPTVIIPVTRSSSAGTGSVNFASSNGTATAGADYTAVSGTLNFAAGVSTLNIVVPIIDDAVQEPNETFAVTLSAPVNLILTAPTAATVTILANDLPTVKLSAAAYSVVEGTPSLTIPVTRSGTTGTASVSYATANGTATAGADYTATTGTLSFAAGVATMNIVVPVIDDTIQEPAETFTVTLSAPVNLVLAAPSSATVTIPANDVPTIKLGAATYSVGEATPSLSIQVTRSSSIGTASVSYATANGTATAGADYTAAAGTLNFAAGVTTLNIVVPILNDSLQEPNETFTVTLSAPVGGTLVAPIAATVTIVDNDVPQTLTVTVVGTGFGVVTSAPAGINCGATCSAVFDSGTLVTLSTSVPFGTTFTGWSGACTGRGVCQVTMSAARSVTATFVPNALTQPLNLSFSGSGRVTSTPAAVDCSAFCITRFETGATLTLNAVPVAGERFLGWTGACTGTAACVLTMSQQQSVTAQFGP